MLTVARLCDVHDGAQKEQYDKRPCNAYMMFMKDFIKNRCRDFRTSKDVVSAGRLKLLIGSLHCKHCVCNILAVFAFNTVWGIMGLLKMYCCLLIHCSVMITTVLHKLM